jgi:hypothetical protein
VPVLFVHCRNKTRCLQIPNLEDTVGGADRQQASILGKLILIDAWARQAGCTVKQRFFSVENWGRSTAKLGLAYLRPGTDRLSGAQRQAIRLSGMVRRGCLGWVTEVSQKQTVPSLAPLTSVLPSANKASLQTSARCPRRTSRHVRLATSQMRIV